MLSFLVKYILPDSSSSGCTTPLFPTSGAIFFLEQQPRDAILVEQADRCY